MRWHIIAGLCLLNHYRHGAEIGVSTGMFTKQLFFRVENLSMICVDRWAEQPEYIGHDDEGRESFLISDGWNHEEKYQHFLAWRNDYKLTEQLSIRRQDSIEAAKDVEDGSLDFVFIDADHSYEGCLADIHAWSPKVRSGGMVAGHDYDSMWPGVIRAVTETGKARTLPDRVWVRFKP